MEAATIRKDEKTLGGCEFQAFSNALRNDVGSLDGVRLHVDSSNSYLKVRDELAEKLQIFLSSRIPV
jgi:hypothetical protein